MRRFLLRLCLELGQGNPDRLLKCISARQLREWAAYDNICPIGLERVDVHFGILCSLLANIHRGKHGRKFKPEDFMPFYWAPKPDLDEEQTAEEAMEIIKKAFAR